MNKKATKLFTLLFLLAAFPLTGCSSKIAKPVVPEKPDSSAASYDLGKTVTISNPGDPYDIQEIRDAISFDEIHYALWTIGESETISISEKEEMTINEAQLYLLVTEDLSEEEAKETINDWTISALEKYPDAVQGTFTQNDITYQSFSYTCSEDSPYERGISAYASCGDTAICAEFIARDSFQEDLASKLEEFLVNCTYHEK